MLIMTAKVPKRKLTLGVAAAALLCCCAIALNFGRALTQEVSAPGTPSPKGIRTNADRVEYLSAYGWQVSEEPISTQELLIPEEMDASYTEYLTLQTGQGFDLEDYAGKRVKRYTYEVFNYPTGESGVQVNLLVCKNTVVGGEVLSPRLDGFLHGLAMP
ncbi:hypothetical protein N510_000868 [Firmicutes bacterium ASF500]|nr:hypothetical protein N510_000868 [Firmicutes bacterium ASF500]